MYPELNWDWGMFGENLTVEGLDESIMRIGDIYKIGNAIVQVSQPREPCYKLGVRFGNAKILKECFQIILTKQKDPVLLQKAINNPSLPEYKRDRLKKYVEQEIK